MMKVVLAAVGLVALAGQAQAISRYQSMSMSCSEVKSAVRSEGAVILRWQSKTAANVPRYDRFVSDSTQCSPNEVAAWAYVPTQDSRACMVKKCELGEPDDHFSGGRIFFPQR